MWAHILLLPLAILILTVRAFIYPFEAAVNWSMHPPLHKISLSKGNDHEAAAAADDAVKAAVKPNLTYPVSSPSSTSRSDLHIAEMNLEEVGSFEAKRLDHDDLEAIDKDYYYDDSREDEYDADIQSKGKTID
jgi:hypothetical protein